MKALRNLFYLLLIVTPFIYLAIIWSSLPQNVPIHFNDEGPDDWASKTTLLLFPCILPLGIFLLMSLIPLIDPKKKIKMMGDKYHSFKLLLTFFLSVLACYTLFVTKQGSMEKPQIMFALIGLLLAAMGNYFQTVRPNYFIGIRTPWTLEDEDVWKSTHLLGGRIWLAGGLLIVVLSFILKPAHIGPVMTTTVLVMALIPSVYSYILFNRKKKNIQPNNESK